jgi:hypothetical protein
MKTIFLSLFSLLTTILLGQNIPINFESSGNGANWTWTTFENDLNPPLEIIANPDTSGINTSSTVAKYTALQTGNPWAGFESMHGTDIGSFSFNSSNCTVKIMVWKSVISDVGIKFVSPSSAAQPEIKIPNTKINEWEEITFDFSSLIGVFPEIVDQIVVFPDFDLNGRTQDNVVFIDNIYGSVDNTSMLENEKKEIKIYPNPSNGVFNFSNIDRKIMQITICDITGKEVLEKSVDERNFAINLKNDYSKGSYLIKFSDLYGNLLDVKKIILE